MRSCCFPWLDWYVTVTMLWIVVAGGSGDMGLTKQKNGTAYKFLLSWLELERVTNFSTVTYFWWHTNGCIEWYLYKKNGTAYKLLLNAWDGLVGFELDFINRVNGIIVAYVLQKHAQIYMEATSLILLPFHVHLWYNYLWHTIFCPLNTIMYNILIYGTCFIWLTYYRSLPWGPHNRYCSCMCFCFI